MGVLYQGVCFQTAAAANAARCADYASEIITASSTQQYRKWCSSSSDSGFVLSSSIVGVNGAGSAWPAFTVAPVYPSCDGQPGALTWQDAHQLSWLVVAVWVAAYGVRHLWRAAK